MELEYLPAVINLQHELYSLATEWKNIPMLARTHGQPASPTSWEKRLWYLLKGLKTRYNYSAIFLLPANLVEQPEILMLTMLPTRKKLASFANEFVENKLGLQRQQYTTQIEHYDLLAAHFDAIKRINNILIDFCRDIWTYISMDYFKQKIKKRK